ncbi:MAG TPA: thioredoxin domain-containing protein [Thermoanaerobaculia bacterium]|nr:thioredoxin domain-containing protein [Thermoanaerobaculia bacterium]
MNEEHLSRFWRQLPEPLLTSEPMSELFLRGTIVMALSTLFSVSLALASRKATAQPRATQVKETAPAATTPTAYSPAIGKFPALTDEVKLHKSQVNKFLTTMMPTLPVETRNQLSPFLSTRRPAMLLIRKADHQTSAKYKAVCASLPISCLTLEVGNEPPAAGEALPSATSFPVLSITPPPAEAAAFLDSSGIYIFGSEGDLVWSDSSTYSGGTPDVVLRVILSVERLSQQAAAPRPLDAREGSPALAPAKEKSTSGKSATREQGTGKNQSPSRDGGASLSLMGLANKVISLDSSAATAFNASWAAEQVFHKKKSMLLVFWGTWCAPCVSETPELGKLSRKYPSTLFVGLLDDPDNPKVRAQAASIISNGGFRTHYLLQDNSITRKVFNKEDVALPAFALFDGNGILTATRFSGSIALPENRALLEAGLAKFEKSPGAREGK